MREMHYKNTSLHGELKVPGDKSISHRAIMFGAVANGVTTIDGFLLGDDCLSTVDCFRKMGVQISIEDEQVTVIGKGWDGLKEPIDILDVGNSGTTTRLMLGILAGRPIHAVIIGDESIAKRPMKRVTDPLREMNASIDGREGGQYTPLSIRGGNLQNITYTSPVASAQVKSAILLAGIQTKGITTVIEPETSRDHTERMIRQFGGAVEVHNQKVAVRGPQNLTATHISVPGDISSAAFFLVAGAITPSSSITLHHVGLNPTRNGIIRVLEKMGAKMEIVEENVSEGAEPIGSITISTSTLKGITVGGEIIPTLIDEIPIIALLATQASGETIIKDAEELKVKETNRIDSVVSQLKKLGANIEATDDGMKIIGPTNLHGAEVESFHDHRIGMMLSIASFISETPIHLKNPDAISVSYPNFFRDLESLLT
ncbi:3-phosphoshikimate 1-carboxyvinyltransferase [Mangrovibacillus cuniculi]|uniref:3-phosphoshikimate 1-carboxyvinyltransferase n=1 Tax=Mangrovibacillus cuniculi TaxID=2593652 RepID=A0A7S8CB43_9BACI|nr:3-phosphoshikimate 1-carboxyvinyltransferase [Mangrovibacillus cuniculi]QPC46692.1 3-phosphoshikimate 1-carboxyvinyltransferase [Mangrovibacillus cuniculi]